MRGQLMVIMPELVSDGQDALAFLGGLASSVCIVAALRSELPFASGHADHGAPAPASKRVRIATPRLDWCRTSLAAVDIEFYCKFSTWWPVGMALESRRQPCRPAARRVQTAHGHLAQLEVS